MEVRQYWNLVRKWLWLVVLGAVLAGGTAFLVSRNMTPIYQASTTLLVTPGSAQALDNYSSLIASERLARTYAQLLQSAPVREEALRRLEEGQDPSDKEQSPGFSVSAEPVRDTQLIRLYVTGTDPGLITTAANTLVEAFVEWQAGIQQARYADSKANLAAGMEQIQASIYETEAAIRTLQAKGDTADLNELTRLQEQLAEYRNNHSALLTSYSSVSLAEASSGDTIAVVSPAVEPKSPIRPQVMRNTMLAAVVGAMLAAGVAFLIEYLDDTVKTPEDLRAANLTAIAAVQRVSGNNKDADRGLFTLGQPKSLASEAFRTLRTNLQFSSLDKPVRSLVVTSAVATEGKTTTSANLAVVMAQAGKRVVLVDGDLRRPSAHKFFNLPNRQGLTTALVEDPAALNGFLQETEIDNLSLLTAGPVPPNPQELLGSQRMQELLHALEEEADIVLVDTPPSLVVADANVLAARADGVLLVVNTGRTRRAVVEQAVEGLRQVGANVLGGVLNMVDIRRGQSYYYYSHHYDEQEQGGVHGLAARLWRLGRRPKTPKGRSDHAQSQD